MLYRLGSWSEQFFLGYQIKLGQLNNHVMVSELFTSVFASQMDILKNDLWDTTIYGIGIKSKQPRIISKQKVTVFRIVYDPLLQDANTSTKDTAKQLQF